MRSAESASRLPRQETLFRPTGNTLLKFFRHAASTVFASRFARSSANFLRRSCAVSWIATRPSRTASGFDLAWAGVWNPKDSCTRYTRAENESPYLSWDYSTVSV